LKTALYKTSTISNYFIIPPPCHARLSENKHWLSSLVKNKGKKYGARRWTDQMVDGRTIRNAKIMAEVFWPCAGEKSPGIKNPGQEFFLHVL